MAVSWVCARGDCAADAVTISPIQFSQSVWRGREFQEEDPSPVITWQWYLLCAWRYIVLWKSCGHSLCPNGIGSYVEQLGTTWSQVLSTAAWSRIGTDAQFHTLDRGRETVDGRTVPVRTRGLNVHATFHLVTMCHGPLLDGHLCSQVASSSNPRAGMVPNELARCELASSQSASSSRPQAGPGRRLRARRSRAYQPADSWRRNCWRFFGRDSLTCKNSFWKGSCKSLLIWNEDCITL
ncbi:UNVERIFIED_CONTAM: hypothetical protein Sradi_7151000 [Sesamum radiatum]|uniref:Uncharacterized protein n=1 Tax=Sesamum radiatum TaxID=300843 RepID=A0AAW2IY29_SESRA